VGSSHLRVVGDLLGQLRLALKGHTACPGPFSQSGHPMFNLFGLLLRIAGSDDGAERISARSVLERVFAGERESTRTIAVMHLVDGMTLEEIASEVNLSVSGVRKRLRTLRARVSELEDV
jgi:DNA-directed RNA polymerase specialized sigma24 family protein